MKLTLVYGYQDWQGLYLNDDLIDENHTLYARDVINALKIVLDEEDSIQIEGVEIVLLDQEWLDQRGKLPSFLHDIPIKVTRNPA